MVEFERFGFYAIDTGIYIPYSGEKKVHVMSGLDVNKMILVPNAAFKRIQETGFNRIVRTFPGIRGKLMWYNCIKLTVTKEKP